MKIHFISSGAGTGKTTQLVKEILERLIGKDAHPKVRPHAVIATTYTNN